MPEISLPHPEFVEKEEFSLQVYRKLTEEGAISSETVEGVASSSDVTEIQEDVASLETVTSSNSISIEDIQTALSTLRFRDIRDFVVDTRLTGITLTMGGVIGVAWEEIGDWDMDANTTSSTWTHTLGIGRDSVVYADALINIDDPGTLTRPLSHDGGTGNVGTSFTSTTMVADRSVAGIFDNTSYDQTSFNRGYFFVVFKP